MTRGSRWISAGRPSAIFSPKSSTAMRSQTFITRPMSCSMSTMVRPVSRIWRTSSIERLLLGRVHARGGLVEQQHAAARSPSPGRSRAGAGRRRAGCGRTSLAPGDRCRRTRAAAAPPRARRAPPADGGASRRARPGTLVRVPGVGADHHVLERGHVREQPDVLERAGDPGLGDLVRALARPGLRPPAPHPRRWARNTPVTQLNTVVLPAPLGPMTPKISPRPNAQRDVVERRRRRRTPSRSSRSSNDTSSDSVRDLGPSGSSADRHLLGGRQARPDRRRSTASASSTPHPRRGASSPRQLGGPLARLGRRPCGPEDHHRPRAPAPNSSTRYSVMLPACAADDAVQPVGDRLAGGRRRAGTRGGRRSRRRRR